MLHLSCCLSVHTYNYKKFMHDDVCESEFNSLCQCTLMAFESFSMIYGVVREIEVYYFVLLVYQFQ